MFPGPVIRFPATGTSRPTLSHFSPQADACEDENAYTPIRNPSPRKVAPGTAVWLDGHVASAPPDGGRPNPAKSRIPNMSPHSVTTAAEATGAILTAMGGAGEISARGSGVSSRSGPAIPGGPERVPAGVSPVGDSRISVMAASPGSVLISLLSLALLARRQGLCPTGQTR